MNLARYTYQGFTCEGACISFINDVYYLLQRAWIAVAFRAAVLRPAALRSTRRRYFAPCDSGDGTASSDDDHFIDLRRGVTADVIMMDVIHPRHESGPPPRSLSPAHRVLFDSDPWPLLPGA